jgi:Domain of unknown function (DUF4111)
VPTPEAAARRFADGVAAIVGDVLGEALEAVYLGGSVALGDYVPGQSDIDMTALSAGELADEEKHALVTALDHAILRCPTRGLELVVYSGAEASNPGWPPRFELNLNAAPRMPFHASFDPASEPTHWFVIDLAVLRERGQALVGPPANTAFGSVPRERILDALEDVLAWHVACEAPSSASVLNACRAWRFAEERIWSSKAEAAAWLRGRHDEASLIDAALGARENGGALDGALVRAFVDRAREAVAMARGTAQARSRRG